MTDTPTLVERIETLVSRRAAQLQAGYRRDDAAAVAELAILRRGVSMRPGADARLIGLTFANLHLETRGLPDEPTAAERAVYAALTLFAVHQQSQRDTSMHRPGASFGESARILVGRAGSDDAIRRRFTVIATATSWEERTHHARAMIQQFRAQSVSLDYGRFARDLYGLQDPRWADRVRLAWGRDFYRVDRAENAPSADSDDPPSAAHAAKETS
jgi:CRISPR system Cascade subunit CasB